MFVFGQVDECETDVVQPGIKIGVAAHHTRHHTQVCIAKTRYLRQVEMKFKFFIGLKVFLADDHQPADIQVAEIAQ